MDVGGAPAPAPGSGMSAAPQPQHGGASTTQPSPTAVLSPSQQQHQQQSQHHHHHHHHQQSPQLVTYSPTTPQSAFRPANGIPAPYIPISAAAPAPVAAAASTMATSPTNGAMSNTTPNPRQRSSIACLHCRRSKIRCVNTGIDTTCTACRNTGRECKYSVEIFKRSRVGEEDPERSAKRSKSRRIDVPGNDGSVRAVRSDGSGADGRPPGGFYPDVPSLLEDGTLDPSVLTPDVWTQLYEIFEKHFGTDLPFLHSPTFLKRLRESPDLHPRADTPQEQQKKNTDPEKVPGWEILVLGILALTARFHPKVVEHLCAGKNKGKDLDPIYASEHYAIVLRQLVVGSKGSYIGIPDIAKVQALLMLGVYEWGTCRGIKAWLHVGLATRMAQAMGLQYEDDKDILPLALSSSTRINALHLELGEQNASVDPLDPMSSHAFIEEEMRRRTFWSCFILDRYLSPGKYRPSMLMLDDLRLQLPCSQNAFLFGDRVCTEYIDGSCSGAQARTKRKIMDFRRWLQRTGGSQGSGADRQKQEPIEGEVDLQLSCEAGPNESALSLHVRMVEIWGRIAKWSCAGGVSNERYAPWHPSSDFYRLRDTLTRFENSMPRLFRLSRTNIQAHIAQHTISAYSLLQIMFSFSVIILHRELLPFVPVRNNSPQGPLEQSQFATEPPTGFYVESARQLFKAARNVSDLIVAGQSRIDLPETPVAGFGLYQVAFVDMYAIHFPHMDPDGYVSGRVTDENPASGGAVAANKILQIIADMRRRLPMADNWFRTLHRVHRYYDRILHDVVAGSRHGVHSSISQQASSRKDLETLDRTFRDHGLQQDDDVSLWAGMPALSPRPNHASADDIKPAEGWNPVNGPSDSNHRPQSSGQRYGDGRPYTGTPPHTITQPPGLSRGSTPTPSASSLSPYQAPSGNLNHEGQETHVVPPLQQQLAHAATNLQPSNWSTPASRFNQLPPLTPTSAYQGSGSGNQENQQKNPVWLPDMGKSLGGDDVAAFMDGLSCQEWAESVRVVHPTWGIKGEGWKGFLDGEERGWLGRVWKV